MRIQIRDLEVEKTLSEPELNGVVGGWSPSSLAGSAGRGSLGIIIQGPHGHPGGRFGIIIQGPPGHPGGSLGIIVGGPGNRPRSGNSLGIIIQGPTG